MRVAAIILALSACHAVADEAKDVAGDIGSELEFACPIVGDTCGQVFLCTGLDVSATQVSLELCWVDDSSTELEASLGDYYSDVSCRPTPRGGVAGWPCIYSCEPHRGCNAYQGCWCP